MVAKIQTFDKTGHLTRTSKTDFLSGRLIKMKKKKYKFYMALMFDKNTFSLYR